MAREAEAFGAALLEDAIRSWAATLAVALASAPAEVVAVVVLVVLEELVVLVVLVLVLVVLVVLFLLPTLSPS